MTAPTMVPLRKRCPQCGSPLTPKGNCARTVAMITVINRLMRPPYADRTQAPNGVPTVALKSPTVHGGK